MYRSRSSIEAKLAELHVLRTQLFRFRGRVFARFGFDETTNTHPVRIALSNFITHARTIIQYAHKEASGRSLLAGYDAAVAERPIFRVFRDLRDAEIHSFPPQVSMQLFATSTVASFDQASGVATGSPISFAVEALSDLDSDGGPGPDVRVEHHVSVQILVTTELLQSLREQGESALADQAAAGASLHRVIEHDGAKDVFQLCERYLSDIDSFVETGIREGFIT